MTLAEKSVQGLEELLGENPRPFTGFDPAVVGRQFLLAGRLKAESEDLIAERIINPLKYLERCTGASFFLAMRDFHLHFTFKVANFQASPDTARHHIRQLQQDPVLSDVTQQLRDYYLHFTDLVINTGAGNPCTLMSEKVPPVLASYRNEVDERIVALDSLFAPAPLSILHCSIFRCMKPPETEKSQTFRVLWEELQQAPPIRVQIARVEADNCLDFLT